MAVRPLKSFFPTAEDLLAADLARLGEVLLVHLNSYEDRVKQHGELNREYLRAMLENRNVGLGPLPNEPEYGARQAEVTQRVMEAWHWLERNGFLIPATIPGWHSISTEGGRLLSKLTRFERWEKLGLDRVKSDLMSGGRRDVGGTPEVREMAWEWVRMKEGQATLPAGKHAGTGGGLPLLADSRIDELRNLSSPDFDFRKLIRLCEELNTAYNNGCYFGTAMLTRGLLDHVPPIFQKSSFAEVTNNYSGGGRSFKDTMHHLENAARKVADGLLHMPIRKSETLPTAQQVCFAPQLDVLLGEIIRIMK
jgi:hypothetical protein